MINLGYACVNMTLSKQKITTGRTVRMVTWKKKGLDVINDCAVQNVRDLRKIVQWNIENDYKLFRVGSELIPWIDHYDMSKLKDFDAICAMLADIGDMARENELRLTAHPGQYRVLCSPNQDVVERTIRELQYDSFLFDLMGFQPSHYNKINIHIGGAYGNKRASLDRWITNWKRLDEGTRARLVIENDDKPSMYTVQDLMYVHEQIGIPITFDYYHHSLNPGDLSEQEALEMAMSTWPENIVPCTHYSECRREEQKKVINEIFANNGINMDSLSEWPTFQKMWNDFEKIKITAHSDYIENEINSYGHRIDCMIEAKAKELAVERYKKIHQPDAVLLAG